MSQLDIDHRSRPSSDSSLYHRNLDDNNRDQRSSTTPPNSVSAKRYATYELNWRDDHSDYNSIDDTSISEVNNNNVIDPSQNNDISTNSAQAARCSLPEIPPPTIPLPPVPQDQSQRKPNNSRRSKKTISINTTKRPDPRDKNENEPQSPFGGITVTTIKVVEVHSPTEKNENISNDKTQQTVAKPVGIITSERRKRKNNRFSYPPPLAASQNPPPLPHDHKEKLKMNQGPKKQKKRISIMNPQILNSSKRKTAKPEMIIPKEMAFIDARLLRKSLIRTQTTAAMTNRNRKTRRGGNSNKKRMVPKNFEFAPTSNPIYSNDPTDMEADLPPIKSNIYPWIPISHKPPQLIHASLVPLPHRLNNPNPKILNNITNNVNDDDVPHQKRNSKVYNSNSLSRVNSQRRRASVASQNPNRASLIFRRQILEESLMMSFGGMMMGGVGTQQQQPISPSKPPIRRKTKKGSNAKVEDREKRRERRRKEKLEKKLAEDAQNNVLNNNSINDKIEGTNIDKKNDEKISKGLETDRIIESQIEKGIYMGPQPPPRKSSKDTSVDDYSPPLQKSKSNNNNKDNNTLSLFVSPSERRLGSPNIDSSSEPLTNEPPPFPAHLARSTSIFEHNSSKEISIRKQPPFPLPVGRPLSSPLYPISNHSRLMPSPLEENELVNEEESQYDVISPDDVSTQQSSPSNKSQKTGMGILGFFNKQAAKDTISPPLSQVSSPVLHPTQLSPQSPRKPVPLTLSSIRTPPFSPPQSPPLSPSRALRIPQQLLRSRRGTENIPSSPPAVTDPEKLRKMEQFEALIANSETSSNSKRPITEKIKALTTAITTAATTASSSSSSSITTSNASFDKRKKSSDGTPYTSSPRHSSEANSGIFKTEEKESEQRSRNSSNSSSSLANSLADSIHYKPDEKLLGKQDDDGVIRVTLTPAVCR